MNLSSLSVSSGRVTSGEPQALALKEGQMIHGKITQLFPGQMAQVQVGNHQLHAKLEVPMQAGDTYYFKVNGTEPEVQLQVVSGPMRDGAGQSAQLNQLMESLNLPKTQEMKDILATIIKQKIPMTKENMLEAVNLLKSVPDGMKAAALATLGKIAEARLPFTPAIFQSLLQAQTGTIAQQLTSLQAAIQSEPNLSQAMREQLLSTMQALASPISQAVGKELLTQSMAQLLDPQASKADRFAALQLLKSADVLPARTSLANLPQVLAELVTKTSAQPMVSISATVIQTDAAKAIPTIISQLNQTPATSQQAIKALVQNVTQQLSNTALPESSKNALQTIINQLTQQPMTDSSKAAVVEQFNKVLTQSNQTPAPPATVQTIQTAISQLSQTASTDPQAVKSIVQNLTQQLSNSSALPESMKQALQTALTQFSQQPMTEGVKTALVEQLSQTLVQQVSRQETTAVPLQQQVVMKDVQQTLPSLVMPLDKADEAMRALLQAAEKSGNVQVKQMVQAAEVQVSQTMNGPVMKEAMQHVLSALGINYEAVLGGKDPVLANLASSLKPQLVAMLQDPSLSPPLRDAAETMVLRMNGTVIQSGDNGLQQQLIMQLPLEMFGKKIDATLQWNGRMKEDGKIDPAHARIVFYLELESLSTTVVDMHVQNKVVNLTIFNEIPSLKNAGSLFQNVLKEGLESVGYKLSGVTFKPFKEEQKVSRQPTSSFHLDEGGVDYRI